MGKKILFIRIWFIIVFAQFSSRVRHAYAFIFKDVIENPIGLFITLYASGLIVEERLMMRLWYIAGRVQDLDAEDLGSVF